MTETATWVVDRLQGDRVVLVADTGHTTEITRSTLPLVPREGMVLAVPSGPDGPDFTRARHDRAEDERRLAEARDRLDRLKRRDPGGDVTL